MQGGAIGFASTKGIGSTFSFYVKARKIDNRLSIGGVNAAVGLSIRTQTSILNGRSRIETDDLAQKSKASTETDIATKDLHVLIVEDNLVNQRVLAKQLRNLGM